MQRAVSARHRTAFSAGYWISETTNDQIKNMKAKKTTKPAVKVKDLKAKKNPKGGISLITPAVQSARAAARRGS
jgi:hypothetical protein